LPLVPRSPEEWDEWTAAEAAPTVGGAAADAAVREALSSIPGRRTKTVGDLGCGPGRLLPYLCGAFGQVIAVDFAPATLARARRACAGLSVVFRRRDLRDLTPLRHRLDVAVLADAVAGPRASDVDRVLTEVAGSLVHGGVLVATFRARARQGRTPVPMPLGEAPLETGLDGLPAFHESELQYRLRCAGFRGLRLKRMRGVPGVPDALAVVARVQADN
jgi:SAM-dependent methyltransferase